MARHQKIAKLFDEDFWVTQWRSQGSPFDLFFDSRASASTEVSAKEQEAPSSKAEQFEEPQAKPSDAVLEDRIVQAVFDKLRQNKEPQIIINIFGGNHIVAPNAQEAYQQFHSSSKKSKNAEWCYKYTD